ncbi:GNAT family N-acetyltransferase [Actinoplanes sp. NPDC023714]|uniref:GNAT family N-acetyltransferase n=1 Tax=Actinoplanes sp. NPDC023714 TaxID=3154322 RepID=UPI0033CC6D03
MNPRQAAPAPRPRGPERSRVRIEVVRDVTSELVDALGRLVPQLSRTAAPVTAATVRAVAGRPGNHLLIARAGGAIVGTLTLVVFPIPTGVRAWIEDVVVDEAARGHGAGTALIQRAVRIAHDAGARTVDLTSRPSRPAANHLYERLGFRVRDSHLYRLARQED